MESLNDCESLVFSENIIDFVNGDAFTNSITEGTLIDDGTEVLSFTEIIIP